MQKTILAGPAGEVIDAQRGSRKTPPAAPFLLWCREIFIIIVAATILHLIFRSFLVEVFHVPTGSMIPTIRIGDHVLVSKYSYGYGKYSTVFTMDVEDRIWASPPERGDVIIFHSIHNHEKTYIKRLIGLPGDRIKVDRGVISINGHKIKRTKLREIAVPMSTEASVSKVEAKEAIISQKAVFLQYLEELPGGSRYMVIYEKGTDMERFPNTTVEYIVPKGYYFVMGDNRNHSVDSRFAQEMGLIPSCNIQGKARTVLYNGNLISSMFTGSAFRSVYQYDRDDQAEQQIRAEVDHAEEMAIKP